MLTRSCEHRTTESQLHFTSLSFLLQLWLPQTEKRLSPWLLIIPTKYERVSLYSQLLLQVMMRISANSNQLIFYSTHVSDLLCLLHETVRIQSYNTGLVTLSSSFSSSSPLFILLLCKQTAGLLFFCKNYHYSTLQAQELHFKLLMEAYLVKSGLEMRLPWGYGHKGGVGVDGF